MSIRGRSVASAFVGRIVTSFAIDLGAKACMSAVAYGRNYVPLVDSGLSLIGLDISREAIAQRAGHPHLAPDLVQADFHEFDSPSLVAIQVFQHAPIV